MQDKNYGNISIWMPKSLVLDKNTPSYTIATFAVLRAYYSCMKEENDVIATSPTQLCYFLHQTSDMPRILIAKFKLGLDDLIERKYITKLNHACSEYIVDCSKMFVDYKTEPFVSVQFREVRKIFQLKTECNIFELFRYFVHFVGSILNKLASGPDEYSRKTRIVGNMTFNWLSRMAGIAERTLYKYNEVLEEAGLIYIERSQTLRIGYDSDGNPIVSTSPYYYGRLADKEYIKEFAAKQIVTGCVVNLPSDANKKRSLAQKYQMLRQNKENNFDRYEIADIYRYIVSRNAVVMKIYKKKGDESVLKKMRDLSVFEKYGFDTDVNYDEYDEENSL